MLTKLLDTQLAFDSVAPDYDGPSGNNSLIQRMRVRTMAAVAENITPPGPLIDLGCGTGLDALYLARRGYEVTAIDWSGEMVKHTRTRVDEARLSGQVRVAQMGIHEVDQLAADQFAGAYSDLGALNCVPDMQSVAHSLERILLPGGKLVASVIGRFVPWEFIYYAARAQWRRAAFRFSSEFQAAPLNGRTVWTRYYSPRQFQKFFAAAGFQLVATRALGLFLPPPYMIAFAQRHPRLINGLQRIEDRAGGWPLARGLGDHFLIVMKKND